MKRTLLIVLVLLAALGMRAQLTVVSGTVVDNETGDPVAGASVTMGTVAVVTNDKDFRKEAERLGATVLEVKRLKV